MRVPMLGALLALPTARLLASAADTLTILDFSNTVKFASLENQQTIGHEDVVETAARMLGLSYPSDMSSRPFLPAGDLFKRPLGLLSLDIQGLSKDNLEQMRNLKELLLDVRNKQAFTLQPDFEDYNVVDPNAYLAFLTQKQFGNEAFTLCSLPDQGCSATWSAEEVRPIEGFAADEPASARFMEEVAAAHSLPKLMAKTSKEALPHVLTLRLQGLGELKQRYGDDAQQVKRAINILDKVWAPTLMQLAKVYNGRFVVLLAAHEQKIAWESNGLRRRLLEAPKSEAEGQNGTHTNATSPAFEKPSMAEIANYQIFLWTSIGFVVVILSAVYSVAYMDVGRDSLLYANFKTDMTHFKTD